jgi:hypothetical protein
MERRTIVMHTERDMECRKGLNLSNGFRQLLDEQIAKNLANLKESEHKGMFGH